jgi:MFS family permease
MSISADAVSCPRTPLNYNASFAAAVAITFSMVASAPTPIYRLYQQAFGLTPFEITLIFAVYSITIIVAFLTVARLSDFVGRKPMVLAALVLNALALIQFLLAGSSAGLMAARATQGMATGIALSTLGAMITDAAPKAAPTLNSVTAFIGLMLGAIISGALTAYFPWPRHLTFALLLALTVAGIFALISVRETAPRKSGALKVLRPNMTLPAASVGPLLRLFPLTLSAWALGGFYLSLMPSLVVAATGVQSPLAGATVVSALMLSGGASVFVLRGLSAPKAIETASSLLALGIVLTMFAIYAGSAAGMLLGTIVAGIGFGTSYGAALRTLLPLAAAHERAGLLSAYLVASYVSFTLPAAGAGLAAPIYGLVSTALAYGLILALSAIATLAIQRAVTPAGN